MKTKIIALLLVIILITILVVTIIFTPSSSTTETPQTTTEATEQEEETTEPPQTVKIIESRSTDWDVYTSDTYGISFGYPETLSEVDKNFSNTEYDSEPWEHIVSFAGERDYTHVDVFLYDDSLANYKVIDQLGGSMFCYVTKKFSWFECSDPENMRTTDEEPALTETVSGEVTYVHKTTEEGWSHDQIIIPSSDHEKVFVIFVTNWDRGYLSEMTKEYVSTESIAASVEF